MVTVHTGGKPPRSCQGESKTGPRASRARTAEGEAVEPVEAVEKLGGNKWKQMETNGNKDIQTYPNYKWKDCRALQLGLFHFAQCLNMLNKSPFVSKICKVMYGQFHGPCRCRDGKPGRKGSFEYSSVEV